MTKVEVFRCGCKKRYESKCNVCNKTLRGCVWFMLSHYQSHQNKKGIHK